MLPIEAITNRLSALNIRSGGAPNTCNSWSPKPSRPHRSSFSKEEHQQKVEVLLSNPKLFAEFKKRVSESNNFSNTSASFILHHFLEELKLPEETNEENGFNNGFGLLQSLRTMTLEFEPTSPNVSYQKSPRGHFACPESPKSQVNLSPTKTPLTPISATTASTASTTSPTSSPNNSPNSVKANTRRSKGAFPACLEQPTF